MIGRLLLALLTASLMVGPLGRYGLTQSLPNLAIVVVWLSAWLSEGDQGYWQAILIGLALDLTGFLPFGFWTVTLLLVCLGTRQLQRRFFTVSSWVESLASLLIVSLSAELIFSLVTKGFLINALGLRVLATSILGLASYYVVAMRLRLFQRWRGIRV